MSDSYDSLPKGPDPGFEGAAFLGWLKKRGAIRGKKECERRCQEFSFTAKEFIAQVGVDYILIAKAGNGNTVVKLVDKVWADQWMTYYDLEVPHHSHWKSL